MLTKKGIDMHGKFFFFIVLVVLTPSWVIAWDDVDTHPAITERAVDKTKDLKSALKDQLGLEDIDTKLSDGLNSYSIKRWLQTGSRLEDDPLCRAANHFHNPWKPWDQSELTDPTRTGGSHHA
ncbi:MAG: hypothetical protein D3908_06275 [Candidatus Electrothrix sp. AUS4]|nr:hypothetical protein [Candidatus Electrothrix sp. AUS4]